MNEAAAIAKILLGDKYLVYWNASGNESLLCKGDGSYIQGTVKHHFIEKRAAIEWLKKNNHELPIELKENGQ